MSELGLVGRLMLLALQGLIVIGTVISTV
jgi:hypothetical protein